MYGFTYRNNGRSNTPRVHVFICMCVCACMHACTHAHMQECFGCRSGLVPLSACDVGTVAGALSVLGVKGQHSTDAGFVRGCGQVECVSQTLWPAFVKVTDAASLASLRRIKSMNVT